MLVDSEGIDDVACHDGIGDSAVWPLIQVQCLDGDEAGVDCVWALIQHHLIMWLLEHRSVVILVHDSHVHVSGGLERRTWSDVLVRRPEGSRLTLPPVFFPGLNSLGVIQCRNPYREEKRREWVGEAVAVQIIKSENGKR